MKSRLLISIAVIVLAVVACKNPFLQNNGRNGDPGPGTGIGLPPLTGTVTVTGTRWVGHTLTANTAGLGGSGTINFQWMRGSTVIGTNSDTYTVQDTDEGYIIILTVTRPGYSGSVVVPLVIPLRMNMAPIAAGSFTLGEELGTAGAGSVTPTSTVYLSAFRMSRFLVTQEQFEAVMEGNNNGINPSPSHFHGGPGREPAPGDMQRRRPVERVNWYNAIIFANRLSKLYGHTPAYEIECVVTGEWTDDTSRWGIVPVRPPGNNSELTPIYTRWGAVRVVPGSDGYRLSTEAQWEFAAKGGNPPDSTTFAGSNVAADVAWYYDTSGGRTRQVGRLPANALGIFDMSGNVWEWCWDKHVSYTSATKTDPTGPDTAPLRSDLRVRRGGSWAYTSYEARIVRRRPFTPSQFGHGVGFRVVRPD